MSKFSERYPNHRVERRNEIITQMIPAVGWYKTEIYETLDDDFIYEIHPVAFFATVEYEERTVWDGGRSDWNKEQVVYANTGTGDEWNVQFLDAMSQPCGRERLFYDPDFRLSADAQWSGHQWAKVEIKELREKRDERKRKNESPTDAGLQAPHISDADS